MINRSGTATTHKILDKYRAPGGEEAVSEVSVQPYLIIHSPHRKHDNSAYGHLQQILLWNVKSMTKKGKADAGTQCGPRNFHHKHNFL